MTERLKYKYKNLTKYQEDLIKYLYKNESIISTLLMEYQEDQKCIRIRTNARLVISNYW